MNYHLPLTAIQKRVLRY